MILNGKTILVTGGTGSLGKVLVRRILSGELGTPKKVIILSRDEAKQHDMRLSYLHKAVTTDEVIYRNFMNTLEFRIGDVRDYRTVCTNLTGVDIIIHAAAMKQVPTCEYFPEQAIITNCVGPMNIVAAIREHGFKIETVVGISTDKACKPVNVMGMTKSLQERVFTSANVLLKNTKFVCVRYGNVLASRGSVIPLFHEQIKNGGPVTITVPDMTRFLMNLNESVDTIFAALKGARAGEIYIPRVKSATVINVAKALIGDRKIEIKVTGIRPGEKMHEILISDEEAHYTVERGSFYVVTSMLPELQTEKITKPAITKEFSSGDDIATLSETIAMMKKNMLMIGEAPLAEGGELIR